MGLTHLRRSFTSYSRRTTTASATTPPTQADSEAMDPPAKTCSRRKTLLFDHNPSRRNNKNEAVATSGTHRRRRRRRWSYKSLTSPSTPHHYHQRLTGRRPPLCRCSTSQDSGQKDECWSRAPFHQGKKRGWRTWLITLITSYAHFVLVHPAPGGTCCASEREPPRVVKPLLMRSAKQKICEADLTDLPVQSARSGHIELR